MKKPYTITSRGRVQQVGFRGYAEDLCRQLVPRAITYNAGEDQMVIICEAEEDAVDRLCQLLKEYKLAEITEVKIEEGIQFPHSVGRATTALEQELFTRIDSGVRILEDMNESVKLLENMNEKIGLLENMNENISSIKHDTEVLHEMKIILERIERKL
jgi:acylphosphatase